MASDELQKVHLVSLGCPKNTVDSERMLGLLEGHAYQITDKPDQADVVVGEAHRGVVGSAERAGHVAREEVAWVARVVERRDVEVRAQLA